LGHHGVHPNCDAIQFPGNEAMVQDLDLIPGLEENYKADSLAFDQVSSFQDIPSLAHTYQEMPIPHHLQVEDNQSLAVL
jgi:hypothetical protein